MVALLDRDWWGGSVLGRLAAQLGSLVLHGAAVIISQHGMLLIGVLAVVLVAGLIIWLARDIT